VRAVLRLCEFYLGICFTTEEKARKNLSHGKKNLSHSTVYILPKHPHITKPTQTETLQNPLIRTHTHAPDTSNLRCCTIYISLPHIRWSHTQNKGLREDTAAPKWRFQCPTLSHALHIRVIEQNGNLKFCLWAFSLLLQKGYCFPDPAVFSWERKLSIYSIWPPAVQRNTLGSCIHGAVNHMDAAGSGRSFAALETG